MVKKSPQTAALISFLIVGGGQFYNGQIGKGILFLLGAVLGISTLGILTFILWIISMVDAYNVAKSNNTKLIVTKEKVDFNEWAKDQNLSESIMNNHSAIISEDELYSGQPKRKLPLKELMHSHIVEDNSNQSKHSFLEMNEKFIKQKALYDDGILSFTEFSENKSNYIMILDKSNIMESKEDFLMGILPLKKNEIISDDEINNLKERIL